VLRTLAALTFLLGLLACGDDGGEEQPQEQPQEQSDEVTDSGGEELGPADEGIDGVIAFRVPSVEHTQAPVEYEHQPPTGGLHNPVWLNCGLYTEPQPSEVAVHPLEHGAVWLAYAPDLDERDLALIADLVAADPKVLATPFEDLPDDAAVVATAWARQLAVADADDPRLAEFVEQYVDSTNAPEAGGPCEGGHGEPSG
jgi:Protein of unknown function (DUF3105)